VRSVSVHPCASLDPRRSDGQGELARAATDGPTYGGELGELSPLPQGDEVGVARGHAHERLTKPETAAMIGPTLTLRRWYVPSHSERSGQLRA
jgi:hypothetical protein